MSVTVRYWAAAKAAAGLAEEQRPSTATLGSLLEMLASAHGPELATVLRRCSYLVDEVSPGRTPPSEVPLPDGSVVDVLPPFAGGAMEHLAPRMTLDRP